MGHVLRVAVVLVDKPATAVLLVVILVLSVGLDLAWKRTRDGRAAVVAPAHVIDG